MQSHARTAKLHAHDRPGGDGLAASLLKYHMNQYQRYNTTFYNTNKLGPKIKSFKPTLPLNVVQIDTATEVKVDGVSHSETL